MAIAARIGIALYLAAVFGAVVVPSVVDVVRNVMSFGWAAFIGDVG
jgi:hypothetical protein